ncbi:effector-associated domain EAD1-containing protein [Okeania sp. KiyG1]|uniref:effector-associated domain EAD1-containing protein n=1 Tax=Okeania sp. KiyG1 TaxID=2720165 RepID=UPI001924EE2B|nr:effector-associated domain EAD1-containing protein [Okeania sp. KiyG1]GFZ92001.1 hypothetical protein CYANOKiyG1_02530 [Okeania sp. KiyG1]
MKLTGKQHKQLREAIQSAFPFEGDFKMMLLEEMEVSLDNIVGGGNYNQIVSNLITQLEPQNKILELIEAALINVPNNQELLNCKQQFIQQTEPINIPIQAKLLDVPDNQKLLRLNKFIYNST